MTRARRLVAILALTALPAAGCSRAGELVVAVQTDMAVPKDIDTIKIEVFVGSALKFSNDYRRLGMPDAEVKLPATLGFYAEDDPEGPVRVKVSARVGGDQGSVRVVREVVTEVPDDRVARLPVPIHFLCDGSGVSENGEAIDVMCPAADETCIAGACAPSAVDVEALVDYDPADVYGGGTGSGDGACFDVEPCFAAAEPVPPGALDLDACAFPAGANVNVALRVDGDGMCGDAGCFIALDADSEAGWRVLGGTLVLPPAACAQVAAGKVLGVVTAPVTDACPRKTAGLPTCGLWSASGS